MSGLYQSKLFTHSLGVCNCYVSPPPGILGEGAVPSTFQMSMVFFFLVVFLSFLKWAITNFKFLDRGRPRIVLTQQIIFTRSLNLVPRAFPSKNGWGASIFLGKSPVDEVAGHSGWLITIMYRHLPSDRHQRHHEFSSYYS